MKKTKQYYEAFEICLNQIFSGEETIETVITHYPEFADQLRPELEAAFWIYSRKDVFGMRPGYLAASRQRLVNQINNERGKSKLTKKTIWNWKPAIFRMAFVALFLMVSIFAFRSGAHAVNASLPGDQFYSVKLAVEDFQLSRASDTSAETELRIELVEKRAREAASLLELGRYVDAEVALEGYRRNLSIATNLLNEIKDDPDTKVTLAQKLASTVSDVNKIFAIFVATGELPSGTVATLSSTIVMNNEISATIFVIIDEIVDHGIPIQASLTPTVTASPTSTSAASPEPSKTPKASVTSTLLYRDTPEPSATPKPSDTPEPSKTPAPSKTLVPVKPTDDNSDDPKPTKKPTKTPKPKKPTKTPKDK
jgi:hypothetical protein